jgi:hypothetical protein
VTDFALYPAATGAAAGSDAATSKGRAMSTGVTHPPFRQQQLVDEAVLAYVAWREESATVWAAYGHWSSAAADDASRAHAAYRAALDREETAARVYASLIEQVSELTGGAACAGRH